MDERTHDDLRRRGTMVAQALAVAGAYFAIFAVLMYPVLRAGGYLA